MRASELSGFRCACQMLLTFGFKNCAKNESYTPDFTVTAPHTADMLFKYQVDQEGFSSFRGTMRIWVINGDDISPLHLTVHPI